MKGSQMKTICAALAATAVGATNASAALVQWDAGGATTNWSDAANWNTTFPAGVPTLNDTAYFGSFQPLPAGVPVNITMVQNNEAKNVSGDQGENASQAPSVYNFNLGGFTLTMNNASDLKMNSTWTNGEFNNKTNGIMVRKTTNGLSPTVTYGAGVTVKAGGAGTFNHQIAGDGTKLVLDGGTITISDRSRDFEILASSGSNSNTLTFAGNGGGIVGLRDLNVSDDSTLDFVLNNTDYSSAPLQFDSDILALGNLDLSTEAGYVHTIGNTLNLISYGALVSDTFNGLAEGALVSADGYDFSISYLGGNVSLTAVPEPASLALLGLGGLAMLGRRKRA